MHLWTLVITIQICVSRFRSIICDNVELMIDQQCENDISTCKIRSMFESYNVSNRMM